MNTFPDSNGCCSCYYSIIIYDSLLCVDTYSAVWILSSRISNDRITIPPAFGLLSTQLGSYDRKVGKFYTKQAHVRQCFGSLGRESVLLLAWSGEGLSEGWGLGICTRPWRMCRIWNTKGMAEISLEQASGRSKAQQQWAYKKMNVTEACELPGRVEERADPFSSV